MWFGKETREGKFFKTGEGYTAPGMDQDKASETNGFQVMYKFYKKPMASPFGIMKRSAMMEGTKVSTASSEFRRRWKNTSVGCSQDEFEMITKGYVECLYGSVYSQEWITRVQTSAIKGYTRILDKMRRGDCPRNRPGASSSTRRRHKGLAGQNNWYKCQNQEQEEEENQNFNVRPDHQKRKKEPPGDRREFTNVLFIPHTKEGALKKKLQALEDSLGFSDRVRFMEKTGPSIASTLVKKDPWGTPCGREGCAVCTPSPGDCSKKSMVYRWSCSICKEEEKMTEYYGESSRTLFEIMVEHQRKMEKGDTESPLVEHHQDMPPD